MPKKSNKQCNFPGCPEIISGNDTYCKSHKKIINKHYNARPERAIQQKAYTTRSWRFARESKLNQDPLCENCLEQGKVTSGYLVHHKNHNPEDNRIENLESSCLACHNTAHKKH